MKEPISCFFRPYDVQTLILIPPPTHSTNLIVFLEYFAQEFVVSRVLLAFNFSIPQVEHQEKYPESFDLYSTSFPSCYESCIGQKCAHITVQLLSVNYFGGNVSCDLAVPLLQVWGNFQVKDNYPPGRSFIDVF